MFNILKKHLLFYFIWKMSQRNLWSFRSLFLIQRTALRIKQACSINQCVMQFSCNSRVIIAMISRGYLLSLIFLNQVIGHQITNAAFNVIIVSGVGALTTPSNKARRRTHELPQRNARTDLELYLNLMQTLATERQSLVWHDSWRHRHQEKYVFILL